MNSVLGGEVDEFGRAACATDSRFDDRGGRSRDGDHRAVVVRIERPVEEAHAFDAHGAEDRLDHFRPLPFREIGHAFDESVGHSDGAPGGKRIARRGWLNVRWRLLYSATFCSALHRYFRLGSASLLSAPPRVSNLKLEAGVDAWVLVPE